MMTASHPSAASRRTTAAPMPEAPPVTSATLPANRSSVFIGQLLLSGGRAWTSTRVRGSCSSSSRTRSRRRCSGTVRRTVSDGDVVGPRADREALDVGARPVGVDQQLPAAGTEAEPRQPQRLDGLEERRQLAGRGQVGDLDPDGPPRVHATVHGRLRGAAAPARCPRWRTARGAGTRWRRTPMSAGRSTQRPVRPTTSAATPQHRPPSAWQPWKASRISAMIRGRTQSGSAWWAAVIQVVCTPTQAAPPSTSRTPTTRTSRLRASPASITPNSAEPSEAELVHREPRPHRGEQRRAADGAEADHAEEDAEPVRLQAETLVHDQRQQRPQRRGRNPEEAQPQQQPPRPRRVPGEPEPAPDRLHQRLRDGSTARSARCAWPTCRASRARRRRR